MFLKNVDVNDDDDLTLRMARSTINTQPSTLNLQPFSYHKVTTFPPPFILLLYRLGEGKRKVIKLFHRTRRLSKKVSALNDFSHKSLTRLNDFYIKSLITLNDFPYFFCFLG